MRRIVALAVFVAVVAGGCFGGEDANVTEAGKGFPQLTISFPETAAPGSVQDAELTITNPGPGDMRTVVVAFAAIGPAQGETELPIPLINFSAGKDNSAIVSVVPEPRAVSRDGVVYTFGPMCPEGGAYPADCSGVGSDQAVPRLVEGDSMVIVFKIRIPSITGTAANSVQVYDGSEIDRARGVRMQTLVGG